MTARFDLINAESEFANSFNLTFDRDPALKYNHYLEIPTAFFTQPS